MKRVRDEPVRDELVVGILLREILTHGGVVTLRHHAGTYRGALRVGSMTHYFSAKSISEALGKMIEKLTAHNGEAEP